MSPGYRRYPLRLAGVLLAAVALAAAVLPSAAGAAQRLETFELPSTQGNVDPSKVQLNKVTDLRAAVMLPDGYDEQPDRDWPVVYLLAGIGDNYTGWITSGQIQKVAAGLPAIVVMPESGIGFLMDWWRGGARNGPNWTRYTLDEVIPEIHARYRVRPGRQNHAIGGISMGGYGALLLAGQFPGYFGTAVSLSGLVDAQSLETYSVLPSQIGAPSYESIWGPLGGQYATVNNPLRNVANITQTRVYLHVGNGIPDPWVPFKPEAWTTGAAIEGFALTENLRYELALAQAGVEHTFKVRVGVHDWPYWTRELPRAIKWGLFNTPRAATSDGPSRWLYRTMAPHGNAWNVGYRFEGDPSGIVTIERDGDRVKATGVGTITLSPGAVEWDSSGAGTKPQCQITAAMPFTVKLPAGCLA